MAWSIQISRLSKMYRQYSGKRALLRELLLGRPSHRELWVLRDVSFSVAPGQAFGVVGDNGTGKTTLLKILTGTSEPTDGQVEVQGKVSALLELGAGFVPDFTGRANIYLSGALMGLSREEVAAKEQEIIDFAELHDSIDQPVRNYSSGMYLRLGFSVATGFDPAVLIIDEALAVGDQSFQKKCTNRIMDFRRAGKTILFCSHNLYQVRRLCDQAIWLDYGRVMAVGSAGEVIDRYTDYLRAREKDQKGTGARPRPVAAAGEKAVCNIEGFRLCDQVGQERSRFKTGETLCFEARARFSREFKGVPGLGISIIRNDGTMVYTVSNTMDEVALEEIEPGVYLARLWFPEVPLLSGRYSFTVSATDEDNLQCYDVAEEVAPFVVEYSGADFGITALEHHWGDRQGRTG